MVVLPRLASFNYKENNFNLLTRTFQVKQAWTPGGKKPFRGTRPTSESKPGLR
jgi:hypothetical protein